MAPANQSRLSALSGPPKEFCTATVSAGHRESVYQMLLSKYCCRSAGGMGRGTPPPAVVGTGPGCADEVAMVCCRCRRRQGCRSVTTVERGSLRNEFGHGQILAADRIRSLPRCGRIPSIGSVSELLQVLAGAGWRSRYETAPTPEGSGRVSTLPFAPLVFACGLREIRRESGELSCPETSVYRRPAPDHRCITMGNDSAAQRKELRTNAL